MDQKDEKEIHEHYKICKKRAYREGLLRASELAKDWLPDYLGLNIKFSNLLRQEADNEGMCK